MKHKLLNKLLFLALLTLGGVINPVWGAENDTHDFSQTLSQLLNNNAAISSINITAQDYPVKEIIVSYNYNKTIDNAVTISATIGGNNFGSSYNVSGSGNSTATFSGDAVTGAILISFVNNTGSGTGHGTFNVTNVRLVEGAAAGPSYTITAVSNDEGMGTVSGTTTITASPKSGYRVKSGDDGYTITSGTASVKNNGNNTFTVSPSTDCTIQINFEAIPTHTATFYVNGNTSRTATVAEGSAISFPTAVATPSDATEIPEEFNGKTFVGWFTEEYTHATDAPAYVNTSTTMGNEDVTYYAVYADVVDGESDNVEDAVKAQTLQYDTWSYSGSTTDKSSYRLFHSNSYIESASFDLSKLIKVVVKGGTFGGDSYNSLTIGDGTNTWKNVTVSGNSATGTNTYTGGTALTGTNKLRITCNSGTASSTGVRISQVDIYVKGTVRTESNYTTDARYAADITFANDEVDVKLSSGYSGQALTNPNSLTIAYSSSDETVATVNSSTGVITELLKAGSTTITATFAGNETYKPAEVSYDLNITEKTPHGLSYATSEVEKLTTDDAFTNTLTNGNSLTVSYSSSATSVATVNSSTGEVTIKGAGSTTITATFEGDEDFEAGDASYTLTVSKATPTLSFASDNAIGREGEAFVGNALTNPANLTVSYSSSDTDVATVNSSTGAVTIVADGTTTITASFAGNDTYTSGSASYTLKVLDTPTILVEDDEIAWGETFTVDDTLIEGGSITVTSGNTSVATVDGLEITPVACGAVEITVSTAENETYKSGSETFTLTINQPTGKTTAAEVKTTFTDKNLAYSGTGMDWTASKSANSFESSSPARGVQFGAAIGSFTLTSSADNVTKVSMVLSTNGTGNTIGVNVGGNNFSTTYGDIDATNTLTLSSGMAKETVDFTGTGSGTITISVSDGNKSVYFKSITVVSTITKKLNASGYATFCSDYSLDFSDYATADYSAWEITNISESEGVYTITFNQLTGPIKGGQGILLRGTANATVTLTSKNSTNVLGSNLLEGTLAPTYVTAGEYYGLSGENFVRVATSTVPAGKALLPASEVDAGSPVKGFVFVFEDDATGIRTVETISAEEAAQIFDLSGRHLNKAQKGINIVNGKKVLY